jgi:hypothetical protein
MALHAAIGWAMFTRTGQAAWLLLAVVYAAGKHAFHVGQATTPPTATAGFTDGGAAPGRARRLIRLAGHADVRWHLWIALALVGRLEWALLAYAPYYPGRLLASALSRRARSG